MQARTLSVADNAGSKIATVVCSERSYYYAEYYEVFCFWNINDEVFNTVLASFSVKCRPILEFFWVIVVSTSPIFFITSLR